MKNLSSRFRVTARFLWTRGFLGFMNRAELQQLAEMRLSDAKKLLFLGGNDDGAFYIAGYAVECALKAVIAKEWQVIVADWVQTQSPNQFPSGNDLVLSKQKYHVHNIKQLQKLARLDDLLATDRRVNSDLDLNWKEAESWSETARYELTRPRQDAVQLVEAISDPVNGVLQWIKNYW